jgi:predicted nucleic acid-binding protein
MSKLQRSKIESDVSTSSSALVLDSSAIASIFFKERYEDKIIRIIEDHSDFATLDIAYAEVGSAAWKSVVLFKQAVEPTREALRQAADFISDNCIIVASKEIINESFELGTKHKIQIYDSMFLSLAKKLKAQVLTTDERLHNKINEIKELRGILFPINFVD